MTLNKNESLAIQSLSMDDYEHLIEEWLESEENGVQFPVPFDTAWQIAGYSSKSNGKRGLRKLREGIHFVKDDLKSQRTKSPQRGRPSEYIQLSCDGLKHFCLAAETQQGEDNRDYFIRVEKQWRLLKKQNPQLAQQIEFQQLQLESAKVQLELVKAQRSLIDVKHGLYLSSSPEYYAAIVDGKPLQVEPPEPDTKYVDSDGNVLGITANSRSLSAIMRAVGVSPNGKGANSRKGMIKDLLQEIGIDLDSGEGCERAAYLQSYNVIPGKVAPSVKAYLIRRISEIDPNIYQSAMKRIIEGK